MDVCRQIQGLDPTLRALGMEEQLLRSTELLKLTADQVRDCAPADLLGEADQAAKKRRSDFDANLELAAKLWQARKSCGAAAPEYLSLTLNKLAQ
jgi:hypothetical protein